MLLHCVSIIHGMVLLQALLLFGHNQWLETSTLMPSQLEHA
jgi:hypothetical protein